MKKLFVVALVAALVIAAFVFKPHLRPGRRVHGLELAPAETIAFAQLTDWPGTCERWKKTGLFKLWSEPEVQAFLEKPRAKMASSPDSWMSRLEQFERISPREAFVAVQSIDGPAPKIVGGIAFAGSRAHAEALLAEPKAALRKAHPAGKADLVSYAGVEIETFTDKETTLATAFRDDWLLISTDLPLLEQTLDRYDRKQGTPPPLGDAPILAEATGPLPAERDAFVFVQLGSLVERFASLMAASGQKTDEKQLAELKQLRAIAAATRIDGELFHDTIFVLGPGSEKSQPLSRHALALSSAATVLFYSAAMPEQIELPESSLPALSMFLPALAPMEKALAAKGLKVSDLSRAFGPEFGMLLDWNQGALQPSIFTAIDVRDAAIARSFVDVVTAPTAGGPSWTKAEADGVTIFTAPVEGLALTAPSVALTEKFLVAGLSAETVKAGLGRLKSGEVKLDQTAPFQKEAGVVSPATKSFAYLDLKALVERSYGTMRPLLIMSLAFAPDAGQWIDAGKLPGTETLTRHLSPVVMSQSETARGTLIESAGTLTLNQTLVGVIGGSLAAALPNLKTVGWNPAATLPFGPKATPAAPPAPSVKPPPSEPVAPPPPAPAP